MKRTSLLAALAATAVCAFASEELDIYTMLYQQSTTAAERFSVLRNISDAKVPGAGALYAQALGQLLTEQPSLRTTAEKETADSSAQLLAALIGQEKYAAAAGDLWRVVENFDNPLVKADALIALGKTRAPELLPQVLKTINGLNLRPTSDPEAGEKVAYGAIIALEKYRAMEGYTPVFFAANGWYSRRIKDQATATLPFIVDDPTEPLSAIIKSEGYPVKLLALEKANESKAPAASKAKVAAIAHSEGWRAATNDIKEKNTLAQLRKLAIKMLVSTAASDPAAVPSLEKSYKEGIDTEERLSAITALSVNRSDDSARALSSFMMVLNAKRRANNITPEDERIVRALLPAMGAQGSPIMKPALQAVEYLEWTNAVKVLAADALKKLQ